MNNSDSSQNQVQQGLSDINQAFKERDVQAKAKQLKLPYVNLLTVPINSDLARVISKEVVTKAQVALFFKSGKQLRLAVLNPENPETVALVSALKDENYEVALSLCSEESLKAAHRIYFKSQYLSKEPVKNEVEEKELGSAAAEIESLEALRAKIENSTFDVALNLIQVGAYRSRATDIHFQPEEKDVLVRFRIDGVLTLVFRLSRTIYSGLLKEIKHLSRLKLNVANLPQDGQYAFKINDAPVNVRVSILPSHFGEACVMRLLDSKHTFVDFEKLGFSGQSLEHIKQSVTFPHGLILVTGPTGSGKTTTLYSILHEIDSKSKKVITLEDPIEYDLPNITQSQVDPDKGFDFADGLRAILRQDPDILMVGEIRDANTAETAAQASLTGHLVISTLHTNSAVESIPRLVNMGLKPFILAPCLELIVAQRLVRKLCQDCASVRPITETEKAHVQLSLDSIQAKGLEVPAMPTELRQAVGCDQCGDTGFRGQLAILEVLRFNQELRDLILESKPMPTIYEYINKHLKMPTLHEDGILKAIAGITTLDEVYRVAA